MCAKASEELLQAIACVTTQSYKNDEQPCGKKVERVKRQKHRMAALFRTASLYYRIYSSNPLP